MAKILVTMPDEFLNRVDGLASNEQRTRSELIREALRTYMRRTTTHQMQKAEDNAKILDDLLRTQSVLAHKNSKQKSLDWN